MNRGEDETIWLRLGLNLWMFILSAILSSWSFDDCMMVKSSGKISRPDSKKCKKKSVLLSEYFKGRSGRDAQQPICSAGAGEFD